MALESLARLYRVLSFFFLVLSCSGFPEGTCSWKQETGGVIILEVFCEPNYLCPESADTSMCTFVYCRR
jgi:hypothetical protein